MGHFKQRSWGEFKSIDHDDDDDDVICLNVKIGPFLRTIFLKEI